jgi:hypothetical protein
MHVIYNDEKGIVGYEHTCVFHWVENLWKHTNEHVEEFCDKHVALVHAWKNNKSSDEVEKHAWIVHD